MNRLNKAKTVLGPSRMTPGIALWWQALKMALIRHTEMGEGFYRWLVRHWRGRDMAGPVGNGTGWELL